MNTKQMEYILELSKMRNFNRAAESLYISQPALTYQIKTVEEELGFKIFERTGKGVTITPAGLQFTMVIENVLEELDEAIRQGRNHDQTFSKEVSIGLPFRSVLYYLPEGVSRFRKLYPMIPVTPHFHMMLQEQSYSKVDWDITVSIGEISHRMNNIMEVPLFKSRMFCVVGENDPLCDKKMICAEDIKDRALITINAKYPTIMHHVARNIIQEHHNTKYMAADSPTMMHLIASGTGVALVPGLLNEHNVEFRWIPFDTAETVECVLMLHSGEDRKEVLDFVEVLKEVYSEHKDDLL